MGSPGLIAGEHVERATDTDAYRHAQPSFVRGDPEVLARCSQSNEEDVRMSTGDVIANALLLKVIPFAVRRRVDAGDTQARMPPQHGGGRSLGDTGCGTEEKHGPAQRIATVTDGIDEVDTGDSIRESGTGDT
jgi:hypothetical protein